MAGTLLALPWLLSRDKRRGAPLWVSSVAGAAIVPQSLFTDYEWGVNKMYSMRTHLRSDVASALLLGAAPWIFGFNRRTRWPFLAAAAAELGVVLLSDPNAYSGRTPAALDRAFEKGKDLISRATEKKPSQRDFQPEDRTASNGAAPAPKAKARKGAEAMEA